jgi:CAAX prenyl protease-like protein
MAASIVASAFAPEDQWLYTLKVVAVGVTLWWFRDVYAGLISTVSPVSVAVGLIIGVLWIATDPQLDAETPLGPWLASLPASLALLWLALRTLGSVVLVPIAEELAFRGYLYRALSTMRFEALGPVEFRWFALIASSLAFGILHERWLAASLAGAVYALLMYRSNKLADPIAAHMASNAAIVVWSISTEQWALL